MSTIKSSAENLTLNADGSNNDIKFQSNGVEKASIDQDGNLVLSGTLTSVGIDDNATETAITIDATENVGIGVVPEDWHSAYDGGIVQINSQGAIFSQLAETYITNNVYEPQSGGMKYINTNVATLYSQQTGVHYFRTAASGSADAAITWTTGFEVLNDGKARAKNGLLFGTDTAAANALDDYEEGTWTPSVGGNATYTTQDARYTKVGRLVTITAQFAINSIGTGSTNTLSGLPFESTSGEAAPFSVGYYSDLALTTIWIGGYVAHNTTTVYFVGNSSAASTIQGNGMAIFGNSARIDFCATYHTAA